MLFTTTNRIRLLKEKPFVSEKEMQTFCEHNLELLLNLTFFATEFVVAPSRFSFVCQVYRGATECGCHGIAPDKGVKYNQREDSE